MTDASAWQPIETAPRDGTPIQAKIPGYGSDYVIAWTHGFFDEDGNNCCCWVIVEDQEPPDCWHDGVCWGSNADGIASIKPSEWKPLPPNKGDE
ncbi:hypothetical protein [Rhizobium alvei]|uniref:DUF551 domain-containing protein n=1 Tax=Rhizobium alvei TaxID=1132659 RepID=A0ABT8YU81_9HYPH|nr:hypothetical protein [Rhizobium alvei]MDO6966932.1 hypothetical protein [Rhizobium alvei]